MHTFTELTGWSTQRLSLIQLHVSRNKKKKKIYSSTANSIQRQWVFVLFLLCSAEWLTCFLAVRWVDFMIRGPFLTRLYMCNWIRANVAYRIEEGEGAWLLAQALYSCLSYDQNSPETGSTTIIIIIILLNSFMFDMWQYCGLHLIYSSVMPPFCVLSTHIYIVTYVHCSCTGNAPFCIYY